jgi:hypothetical protein
LHKPFLGVALTAALALPAVAFAAPASEKVTGGGQLTEMGQMGPGIQIAFTAQESATGLKGQFQYNDRVAGARHGVVNICLEAMGDEQGNGMATFAGTYRDGSFFKVTVTDNGEGNAAQDDVIVYEEPDDEPSCDEPAEGGEMALGRGNAQVHKPKA